MSWHKLYTFALIACFILLLGLLLIVSPAGLYYWNYRGYQSLLHDSAGLSDHWSEVGAVIASIIFCALVPTAAHWLIVGRRRVASVAAAPAILVAPPVMHGLLDRNFNQKTGSSLKWYSWRAGGQLTFSDSAGFDPDTGAARKAVTPEVARIWERQKRGIRAEQILEPAERIQFFDPVTGAARIWYSKSPDGNVLLFNNEGFSPYDGSLLLPVSADLALTLSQTAKNQRRMNERLKRRTQRQEERARLREARAVAEHCSPVNVDQAHLKQVGGEWQVNDGINDLLDYNSTEEFAAQALNVIQYHHLTQKCLIHDLAFAGTGTGMKFWKSDGRIPRGPAAVDSDCIMAQPGSSVAEPNHQLGAWNVTALSSSGQRHGTLVFASEAGANSALTAITRYSLSWTCYVGRPHASLTYWLAAA